MILLIKKLHACIWKNDVNEMHIMCVILIVYTEYVKYITWFGELWKYLVY